MPLPPPQMSHSPDQAAQKPTHTHAKYERSSTDSIKLQLYLILNHDYQNLGVIVCIISIVTPTPMQKPERTAMMMSVRIISAPISSQLLPLQPPEPHPAT